MSSINQNLSLFIPYVFINITQQRIASIVENANLGIIDHVDFIRKTDKNNKPYHAVYIHFARWFNNSIAENFQERVMNPDKEARIVYDDPWHWIVLQNTGAKAEVVLSKSEQTQFVSSDYVSILEEKLAAAEKRIVELQKIAQLFQTEKLKAQAQDLDLQNVCVDWKNARI